MQSCPVTTPAQKVVMIVLCDLANDDDVAWPKVETIAQRACLSVSTVRRALRALETSGQIDVERSDGWHHNTYRITFTEAPADATTAPIPGHRDRVSEENPVTVTGIEESNTRSQRPHNPVTVPPKPGHRAPSYKNPINPKEPHAAARDAIDERIGQLRAALWGKGLHARFDRLTESQRAEIAATVTVHGAAKLAAIAYLQHQPGNPARFASAWLPAWRELPARATTDPRPGQADRCGSCNEHRQVPVPGSEAMARCPNCHPLRTTAGAAQ